MKIAHWKPIQIEDLPLLPVLGLALAYAALAIPAWHTLPASSAVVLASAGLAGVLIVLSVIDLKTFRLPDILTLPLILAGIALAGYLGWDSFEWRLASAALGFGSAYLVAHLYEAVRGRSGLGLGDAKLYAASGAWVGGEGLITVLLYACIAALLAILTARVRNANVTQSTAIPFGPFLAAGTWLVWLYGPLA
jgi:leader peptidase (prepilin peptidase) / N-methyltransferase